MSTFTHLLFYWYHYYCSLDKLYVVVVIYAFCGGKHYCYSGNLHVARTIYAFRGGN
jgi:hypothetical protein